MAESTPLSRRKAEVLHSIVREYIETGGAGGFADHRPPAPWRRHVSPATIRNVMADLSDEGYLSQPHTSAGRVPTEKAFRSYARETWRRGLRPRTSSASTPASTAWRVWKRASSFLQRSLTDLTHNVGIAAAIPASSQTLDQIELLPLPDRRVLVIVVTRDRIVRNRVVAVDEDLSSDALASIRNYINVNFGGWVLSDVRQELERRLRWRAPTTTRC